MQSGLWFQVSVFWFTFVSFLIGAHQMEAAGLKHCFERVFAHRKLQVKAVLLFSDFNTAHKKNFAIVCPKRKSGFVMFLFEEAGNFLIPRVRMLRGRKICQSNVSKDQHLN